ncbi:MAG: type II secretion system protein, partial [Planctomycetota bacterium]
MPDHSSHRLFDHPFHRRAFTIVELLVVVSIIAILIGILLPAVGRARDQARLSQSQSNLRQLGTAHETYSAEWNDRQFTLVNDTIARYGNGVAQAFETFHMINGGCGDFGRSPGCHPPVLLGYADDWESSVADGIWGYWMHQPGNWSLVMPINFEGGRAGFGSFRICNA